MEFETGRRSTLARLQLSVQGLAGSLNSAKKVLVASTVLTAAFCGAVFGLTLVANEASKESHVDNGVLIATDGQGVKTTENKSYKALNTMLAWDIASQDFVSFSQDGADRYMQILGVQSTASKKVINTIVGAFEITEEGLTFAGDNVVLEATEADKAARKAQCKFCEQGGRNAQCNMCSQGRGFAVAGRNNACVVCNQGRNLQCEFCTSGRGAQCKLCVQGGRSNQCKICASAGRNAQCVWCHSGGRNVKCSICNQAGRNGQNDCNNEDLLVGELGSAGRDNTKGSSWDADDGGFDEETGELIKVVINGGAGPQEIWTPQSGIQQENVYNCMAGVSPFASPDSGACYGA